MKIRNLAMCGLSVFLMLLSGMANASAYFYAECYFASKRIVVTPPGLQTYVERSDSRKKKALKFSLKYNVDTAADGTPVIDVSQLGVDFVDVVAGNLPFSHAYVKKGAVTEWKYNEFDKTMISPIARMGMILPTEIILPSQEHGERSAYLEKGTEIELIYNPVSRNFVQTGIQVWSLREAGRKQPSLNDYHTLLCKVSTGPVQQPATTRSYDSPQLPDAKRGDVELGDIGGEHKTPED